MAVVKMFGAWLKRLIDYASQKSYSRWIVFGIDLVVVCFSVLLIFLLNEEWNEDTIWKFSVLFSSFLFSFLIIKPYCSIVIRTGIDDVVQILQANFIAFLIYVSVFCIAHFYTTIQLSFRWVELLLLFLLVTILMITIRIGAKYYYNLYKVWERIGMNNVVIFGADDAGVAIFKSMKNLAGYSMNVLAFMDDDNSKVGKTIDRVPILAPSSVLDKDYIKRNKVDSVVLSVQGISLSRKQELVETITTLGLKLKILSPENIFSFSEVSLSDLREAEIDDLLFRDPIKTDSQNARKEIEGKVVLVTGAAGSIGCEIVRQLLSLAPSKLVVLDQSECSIFDLRYELENSPHYSFHRTKVFYEIADVRDSICMENLISKYCPNVIFHAAAYKHVPLMEANPYEAVYTNVFGTKVVADLAIKYGVEKFVMISTDKAVRPTSVMGATKRMAEIYVQSRRSKTSFVTTRFGNVLGSSGSVIPIFRKQIKEGGPVTITHKEVVRYFMTIPEACRLVLEACSLGNGNDILVFDMGEPVKIYDLAKNMVQISGAKDVDIVEVGLRPGEKLYEELLWKEEETLPTSHEKIKHAMVVKYKTEEVDKYISELGEVLRTCDACSIVSKMKEMIPEYKSQNSVFEKLDRCPDLVVVENEVCV